MGYTIRRAVIDDLVNPEIGSFLQKSAITVNEAYDNKYDLKNFPMLDLIQRNYFRICFRNDLPVGLMIGSFSSSLFDKDITVLRQIVLYAIPGTEAAYWLLKDFIDFGKAHADHVITTINSSTNIKPRSLEKLGFKKLETLYRLESKCPKTAE